MALKYNLENGAPRTKVRGSLNSPLARRHPDNASIPSLKAGVLSRRDKAFSLLELLISIAILSIGITVALQALSFSSRVTGLTLDMVKAVFLAEDKIQELEFYEKQKLTSSLAAEVNESQDKFAWAYRIWPEPEFSLLRLDFEVVWQRANRNEKIELSTYLKP